MSIAHTRAMLHAALDGGLDNVSYRTDPIFGLQVPESCPDVPSQILNPRDTWKDHAKYDDTATKLAKKFVENFAPYVEKVDVSVRDAGPTAA